MSLTLTPLATYRPESIWLARRAFFDEGRQTEGLIADAVLRSWRRCTDRGRTVNEPIEFSPVDRSKLQLLLDRNRPLFEAAQPELLALARSVTAGGYAVLLTDAQGRALAVNGAIADRSSALRLAFRPGVDLSEASIGTNAMSVAMSEGRAVSVFGPEHFHTDTQLFHCCAAPVFDPQGEVVGAVDVSRDMPGMLQSALWMSERCAQHIERRMFDAVPAFLHLEVDVGNSSLGASRAWLALGADGELLAASRGARQLMSLPRDLRHADFGALFNDRFDSLVDRLQRSPAETTLPLQDGLRITARALHRSPRFASQPAQALTGSEDSGRPQFGDTRIENAFDRARQAFGANLPVLITGETGTGKDVAARALHSNGPQPSGPFVALNCAAIPAELLAGELFGHVEGAFTGARRGGAVGKIEAADGGTLFLDEIGDMPLQLQAALLRVLDNGEVVRLGSTTARRIAVRIVCATHHDLQRSVGERRFREDLYYRIAGHVLHLLPVRERVGFDDLLNHLLVKAGCKPDRVPAHVRAAMRVLPWPGNVRQLAHAIRRAVALGPSDSILSLDDFDLAPASPQTATNAETVAAKQGLLGQAQEQAIQHALTQCNGNVTRAAQLLGMGRATLYRKLSRQRN